MHRSLRPQAVRYSASIFRGLGCEELWRGRFRWFSGAVSPAGFPVTMEERKRGSLEVLVSEEALQSSGLSVESKPLCDMRLRG